MGFDAAVVSCEDYSEENVRRAMAEALDALGGLSWVTPGMRVAVKANLVSRMKPETAACTHPALVKELCRLLIERGAEVTVGDSPSGLFDAAWVGAVYAGCGMRIVEETGAKLNADFAVTEAVFPEGRTAKRFPYTAWLQNADAVIDFAKLKTHAMAGMTCAVKNFFGVIPGTRKPEYHYLYPKTADFCDMLVDLNLYVKPRLTLVDAVDCMEGNGPTQGTPRHMGALVAAGTTFDADLLCSHLIGMGPEGAPTLRVSIERGLCPDDWKKLSVYGDPEAFALPDFEKLPVGRDITFSNMFPWLNRFLSRYFAPRPQVSRENCVGCGKCNQVCPVGAATLEEGKAVIDRSKCIRCFCCQEFCPKGAVTVRRSALAKLVSK